MSLAHQACMAANEELEPKKIEAQNVQKIKNKLRTRQTKVWKHKADSVVNFEWSIKVFA